MATPAPQAEITWWQKYLARGVGCGGGIIAMGLGVFNCVTLTPLCIVAGIWQMIAAFIVISAEAPCCCMFVDFVQRYSSWVESRPHWQKAAFYVIISLPAIILCAGLSTIFGSGLIFLCGVLYGLMALGKKAYLRVTGYWINPESLKRESASLACHCIVGHHMYDVFAKELNAVHVEYCIHNKVTKIKTDNGSNFVKAFRGSREDMIAAAHTSSRPGNMKDVLVDGGSLSPA